MLVNRAIRQKLLTISILVLVIAPFSTLSASALTTTRSFGSPAPSRWAEGPHASVRVRELNVRAGPGTDYSIVAVARFRELLGLTGRNGANTWLRIARANGQQGWVLASLTVVSNAHLSAVPVVQADPPVPPPSEHANGQVLARRLYVRSGPGPSHATVALVRSGDWLTLIGRTADSAWLQIEWGGVQAWVSASYVRSTVPLHTLPITGGSVPNPSPVTGTIVAHRLNVRSGPGLRYGIQGWLYRGDTVTVLQGFGVGGWLRVEAGSGLRGWVSRAYVHLD